MPPKSKVHQLPDEDKAWLDRELTQRGFCGYEEVERLCRERGFVISKSSLHRYGQDFEERLSTLKLASEQARAIVEASPDEGDAVSEALTRLVQEKMFNALMELQIKPEKLTLPAMAKAIAEVAKASTQQKRWAYEMRQKVQSVADEVAKESKAAGLSDETAELIRSKILGIGA